MATTTATTLAASAGDGSSPPSRSTVMTIAAQAYHRRRPHLACLSYYPNGCRDSNKDCISIFLALEGIVTEDRRTCCARGFKNFIRRDELERSEYLNDDYFAIAAHVIIPKEKPSVVVPPSNMHLHYGDLLVSKEGTDVKFLVGGEMFAAHRLVLAARSLVFKAELFGPTKKGTIDAIQIDNMKARVFKALLGFIYTDIWPEIGHGKDNVAMAQQLLAAADRYGLQRLKFVYEDKLCNHIDTYSVSTMLVLVEKHHCCKLKEACSTFLSSMSPPIVEDPNSSIFGSELKKTVSSSENHGSQINRTDIRIQLWQNADV
nr:BTB/POZ and MATH domain-containing protein 2-like [Oryza sativa Japonica Group]